MAQDMFIKIAGIDGESKDSAHTNEIDVLNWSWVVSQESTMHTGSGGGAGKAHVADLEFEHYVDRATPNLFKYCVTGKHIPEAKLTLRKAGGNLLEYLKITMTDIVVTMVNPAGSVTDEVKARERVALSFAKVKTEYTVQNQQGGSGGAITAGYDIQKNQEA